MPFADLTNSVVHGVSAGTSKSVTSNKKEDNTKDKKDKNDNDRKDDDNKKTCGYDHSDLAISFKGEDTPSCFQKDYKFNVMCTSVDCKNHVKPGRNQKAWHCHGFDVCKCIICSECYGKKLLAIEANAAKPAPGDNNIKKGKRTRTSRRITVVSV